MFESIYFVISWPCMHQCPHCYDARFKPYPKSERTAMIAASRERLPRIVANLPDSLEYEDTHAPKRYKKKHGRIILSGGEVLIPDIRSGILYPAMQLLTGKYGLKLKLIIQTTGELLNQQVISELKENRIWFISIASEDQYHKQDQIPSDDFYPAVKKLLKKNSFEEAADIKSALESPHPGPFFNRFGATPESWIGKLWPSGRAWTNALSRADYSENFCNQWSGGKGFLDMGLSGSEITIDPDGSVYPCCRKTAVPYGNLQNTPLVKLLMPMKNNPFYEAINKGKPETMTRHLGISETDFYHLSYTSDTKGNPYRNRCIGCDRIHHNFFSSEPSV